jgi:glycosyltransferase involved in cell wall biosynthesis
MHNLTKIKLFRIICWMVYPLALLIIYPFVFFQKRKKSNLFFFFDRYEIGGAQRIHIDILNALEEKPKYVYFTRNSKNNALKEVFYSIPNTWSDDIHVWCDYLLFRPFTVHYYAFLLNRQSDARVLGANSTFFYDLLPFLNKKVKSIELLHNFTHGKNGMEFFGLANHQYLTNRIIYDSYTRSNIKSQYIKYNVPHQFNDRLLFIEPGVDIPEYTHKKHTLPLKVLYAGRGGEQKRIPLLNAIAEDCIKNKQEIEFHFAGTMIDELTPMIKDNAVIHGAISNKDTMNDLYRQSHIILMTSAYEGFPMLIKESMSFGCVPVVTALEGNKMHLKNMENALLIEAIDDSEAVIQQGLKHLEVLIEDAALYHQLSQSAYEYARKNFSKEKFITEYRALLG